MIGFVTYPYKNMFIKCSYITLESLNPKTLDDLLVQVRNFLLPLSLKVFRHKERDTIFLCWLFHLHPHPHNTCDTCRKATRESTVFSRGRTQLTDFFQNPPRVLPVHNIIDIPWSNFLSGIFILTSLNDTSSPRVRENLRSCLHQTNPCTEPKGSQPN